VCVCVAYGLLYECVCVCVAYGLLYECVCVCVYVYKSTGTV
jgi:hypothetical protein